MSGENEGEEDKQKDDFSASEEFNFYFPFTKPLVLDLPTEEDRVLASAWVQKLEAEPETNEDKRERLNYLKLLLFVLQRGRLTGIFKKQPPSGSLEPFPQGFSIFDLANWMLEQDNAPTCGGGDAGHVPYTIEMSNDLREFVASQEIPNFGVQMYYAWSSDEPIDKWLLFDEEKFPQYILDKVKQLQEIGSEEKSTIVKNGCVIKKKGCNLTIPEKYSQKKVKSPQEIERSQGRSFHTYMGLVGRMGNFNDKCDDDPKKFQRQDPRKGKCPRRTDPKKCPGSGGEAEEEEEEFENTLTNLGGLEPLNRACVCPYPCYHSDYPENHSKGGPQPNIYEDQKNDGGFGFTLRSSPESPRWTASVSKPLGARRVREQCLESEMSATLPSQKRSASPRPRSSSPNHPNLECPPEDNSEEYSNRSGLCTCHLPPPCPCPCPRIPPKMSVQKTPSSFPTGRGGAESCRTFMKSTKKDPCFNENRGIGTYLTSFTAPENCTPLNGRPDISPVGGRTNTSSTLRPVQPDIIHCYDNQNPDPAITKVLPRVETNADWFQTAGGGNRYMNTDLKLAYKRDQLIAIAQKNKCKLASQRELFGSPLQSASAGVGPPRQPPSRTTRSPPLESHPICEYSPSDEAAGPCPSGQQGAYPQQNYFECEESAPPQTCYDAYETCGRQITDTYNKPGRPTATRVKNTSAYCPAGPLAVKNDTGRLANMTKVLQGIKQKTETHREKCTQMRPPINDMHPQTPVYHSPPQPQGTNACPSGAANRVSGYTNIAQQCPLPDSPYPGYYPNRLVNYQQDECDVEYEVEDECDSTESLDECPQEPSPNQPPRNDPQSCRQQEFHDRDDVGNFRKTPTQGNYGVSFTEAEGYDSKNECSEEDRPVSPLNRCYIEIDTSNCGPRNLGRAHHRNPVSQRDCAHQRTSPDRTLHTESCVNNSPVEFKSIIEDSSSRVSRTQWISPSLTENRYFNESFKARSGQTYQPVTSTQIKHYKRNFKDQGTDDLSSVHAPSNRCA